jgi:hypothetical protein
MDGWRWHEEFELDVGCNDIQLGSIQYNDSQTIVSTIAYNNSVLLTTTFYSVMLSVVMLSI